MDQHLVERPPGPHSRQTQLPRPGPLPRQQLAWWRLPAVLLDWEFAPAWPRVAVLATCAALGFAIGLIGIDRQVDSVDAALAYVSRADVAAGLFEAESLRGENR